MITVLCANPALDVTYRVDRVTHGAVHAVDSVRRRAGGKGANVARVLRQLGEPVRLVAPLGGAGGEEYAADFGPGLVAVPIGASPRSSVCVLDEHATVFNERGPELTPDEWAAVVAAVLDHPTDVLVLSGSLPGGVPLDAYARFVTSDVVTLIDAKGAVLAAALAAGPDVAAPNLSEAQEIVGPADSSACAAELRARGARAAVVSAGPEGLAAVTEHGGWRARPPRVLTGNPTGAGDALTAALARGLARGIAWPDILRDAVSTSAAALACEVAGEIDPALRAELADQVVLAEEPDVADQHR